MKKSIEGLFSTESLRWIAENNNDSWWPPMVVGGREAGVRV